MSSAVGAVAFGVIISLANFLMAIFLSIKALERETTTAAAIVVASFIARLAFLFLFFVYLARTSVWGSYIYLTVAGFITSHLLLMVLEITILLKLEQNQVSKGVVES